MMSTQRGSAYARTADNFIVEFSSHLQKHQRKFIPLHIPNQNSKLLVSDGRGNVALRTNVREELLSIANDIKKQGMHLVVIDTDNTDGSFPQVASGSQHCGGVGTLGFSAYNCYKCISQRLGLRKPWKEKGRMF
jgi:hypothetical protein